MQGERFVPECHARLRVLFPMGLGLLVAVFVLRLPDQGGEALRLDPYLPGPAPGGILGSALRDLVESGSWPPEGLLSSGEEIAAAFPRLILPALAGLQAALFFLALELMIRRIWKRHREASALLPATLFAALPAQAAWQSVAGGETILAAATALTLAVVLAGSRSGFFAAAGCVVGAASPLLHPAVLPLLPAVPLMSRLSGRLGGPGRLAAGVLGVLGAGAVAAFAGSGGLPGAAVHATIAEHRAAWALQSFLAAPALAVETAVRTLLPTGYEALAGIWPVAAGAAVWAIAGGWSMLAGGIVRGGVLLALAAGAGVLAPYLSPQWIPGEKGLLLLSLLPLGAWLALLLAVVSGSPVRDLFIGLSLGACVAAGLLQYGPIGAPEQLPRRKDWLERRRAALQLPRQSLAAGHDRFAPEREPDLVRLVLFMHDVSTAPGYGTYDQSVQEAAAVVKGRIESPTEKAIDRTRLDDLYKQAAGDPNAIPATAADHEKELFRKLPEVEARVHEVASKLRYGAAAEHYAVAALELQELIPRALEICVGGGKHPRIVAFAQLFATLCTRFAELATNIGDVKSGIPVREALVELTGREPRGVAILGRELVEAGRFEDARPVLEEALRAARPQDILWAVTRGAYGRVLAHAGRKAEGLREMNRGWSELTGSSPASGRRLSLIAAPEGIDFWLAMEMLLARYELAREVDPGLEEQARQDILGNIEPQLAFGVRRVPALMLHGRLLQLSGDTAAARSRLREMRAIKTTSLVEKSGGASGRFDLPRWRRLGLETLLQVLDPSADSAERREVEAEIAALAAL